MKEELISKIEGVILGLNQNSIHVKVLHLVKKMLLRLKPSLKINRYEVIDEFVSIELINQDLPEHIEVEITNNNIEIRGDGYEIFQFLDNDSFKLKYNDLIVSFFEGKYKILNYLGKRDKKEAFGVVWNNENLACFNNEKEDVNFFKCSIVREIIKDGLSLIN